MHETNPRDSALTELLRAAIGRDPNGAIPFRDYMELCLYEPSWGYYSREAAKVGKDGDFYTSASIGAIMGEVLGAYFIRLSEQMFAADEPVAIAEWGGGTGRLSALVLDTIAERSPGLYERLDYSLVEISPHHRRLQLETLAAHPNVRHAEEREWTEAGGGRAAIVFSNELLDAFPVHRVERSGGVLYEWHVGWDGSRGMFVPRLLPLDPHGPAARYIGREGFAIREGQRIEVNPAAADWVKRIGAGIGQGALVTIDYGDTAEELYAAHRMSGTFMCYRRHQAHDDAFAYPGEQDMTAHVNFTACIRAGEEAGFAEWSLRTQQRFLLDEGVLELLAPHDGRDPFGAAARRNRAVRQLLLGDSMSELFKVLVQTKKR